VRALRTWRWGAVLAIFTLAVGIGTTTALYALLRVALAESAVEIYEIERVVRIYGVNPALGVLRAPVTFDDFDSTLARARSFESIAAYQGLEMTLGSGPQAETVPVMRVSPRFFEVLRGRALHGRLLTPADRADAPLSAVVSEPTWRRRFAGRRIADAPSIRLNGREHAVVGVLPASFSFPMIGITADVWIPLSRPAEDGARVSVISRLAPGVAWTSALGELSTLTAPLQDEGTLRWSGVPVQRDVRARTGGATVWIFLPAAVVLIIGCVNVACMLLARGMRRETELSVRMALGASRGSIFRQLFIENSLLAVAAGTIGTAVAFAGLEFVGGTIVQMKPELAAKLSGDFGLLPIALTSSVAACLLFGLVPALRLSRHDVASSLKGSAPAARVRVAGYGARDLIVFVELALASVLVVMTAMSFAVVSVLQDREIGFAVNELVGVRLPARDAIAASERVRAVGGVTGVAVASGLPGEGGTRATASVPGGRTAPASIVATGGGFFETAGLTIVRGRSFRPDETARAAVAVVAESAASTFWPAENPIGNRIDVNVRGRSTRLVVIGVARDAIRTAVRLPQRAAVYRPLDIDAESHVMLLARSTRAKEIARHVADAVRPRDAVTPVDVRFLGDMANFVPAEGMTLLHLFGAFALIALLLAGSGIFAVVSQSVTQRTAELGVRLALGATPWRVLRTVLTRELKLIVTALATGTLGTIAMIRSSGFDDAAFIVAVNMSRPEWGLALIGLCGVVAGLACVLATYRVVKLDPSIVLRRL
jgi:predicted permease